MLRMAATRTHLSSHPTSLRVPTRSQTTQPTPPLLQTNTRCTPHFVAGAFAAGAHTAPVPRTAAGKRASSGTARKKRDSVACSPASEASSASATRSPAPPTVASPYATQTKRAPTSASPGGAWSPPVSSNRGGTKTELNPPVSLRSLPSAAGEELRP